jgi:hypothetical protein
MIGLLGLYTSSIGPADLLLFDTLAQIDRESSLNVTASTEIWNAFRNNWSRRYVETVSSTLESPFSIIDADITRKNVFLFRPTIPKADPIHLTSRDVETSVDEQQTDYDTYDPRFWLPIIAYCLKKVTHSSELTQLIESSAIGYAFVCLSSTSLEIRKMASSILLEWEHLCEVRF